MAPTDAPVKKPAVDAFAMMRAAAAGKAKPASQEEASMTGSEKLASPTKGKQPAASSSTPALFKPRGSGLGPGPKHVADPENQPWVEKYRPKNLEELPHMLFYGPPGTGKTSTILALCRQMFGPELFRSRVLELNASDERGISVVRDKIKNFAKTAVSQNHDSKYPAPPFKIIILDEADSMTQDAQSALRRIMENHSRTTRFCLICNYVTRIIEPITSRCSKFRFKPLDVSSTESRLKEICDKENVQCPEDALQTLIKTSDGDLRRAITYLQSASRLHAASKTPLTPVSVQEIGGVVPDHVMKELGRALGVDSESGGDDNMTGIRQSVGGFEIVQKAVQKIVREGYSATQVLTQVGLV
ncbi:Subunit of heteropentameric Replication factor C (RF-C) [Microbotryomycetes sp. JL201]|nr:Subunit of heteropentameric Replication factor C (RF-C) [Microbotryomycetes sp. JL201]